MNRIEPQLPAGAMKTYSVLAPLSSHFKPATCEEVDCQMWQHGWRTAIDVNTELGCRQAHYIRDQSGRRFTEAMEDGLFVFTFEPGQRCFTAHQRPLERDPVFLVRMGDWRSYGPSRVHARAGDWVEDFAEHQQRLADRLERG
jgi:hypothetical protein